jgi:hypothetical protein
VRDGRRAAAAGLTGVVTIQPPAYARLSRLAEVRLGVATVLLFATTAALVSLHVPAVAALTALFVQTVLSSLLLRDGRLALLLSLTGWALGTGFVVNRLGQLTFTTADLVRLAALVVAVQTCLTGRATMTGARRAMRRRRRGSHTQSPATALGVRRGGAGAVADRAGSGSSA